jgi:hypothetical protein
VCVLVTEQGVHEIRYEQEPGKLYCHVIVCVTIDGILTGDRIYWTF